MYARGVVVGSPVARGARVQKMNNQLQRVIRATTDALMRESAHGGYQQGLSQPPDIRGIIRGFRVM
jgi:hypothetical protein